jgi:hypothetical protein
MRSLILSTTLAIGSLVALAAVPSPAHAQWYTFGNYYTGYSYYNPPAYGRSYFPGSEPTTYPGTVAFYGPRYGMSNNNAQPIGGQMGGFSPFPGYAGGGYTTTYSYTIPNYSVPGYYVRP